MGKSKKRKKAKPKNKKRSLRPGRLAAVERIERAKGKQAAKPVATQAKAKAQAPKSILKIDPAATELIARARRVGLSVANDASAGRVGRLLERFDLVRTYVRDVWTDLGGAALDEQNPLAEQLDRFAAGLFSDGRVADGIVAAQQQRGGDAVAKDSHYRHVAKAIGKQFAAQLPARSLWSRVLGR